MSYRNGTYVAFDGNGSTDPTKGNMKYYALLQAWNKDKKYEIKFSDSHKKTYQVLDSSSRKTLENRLMERMRNSKNMLLIISDNTNWDRGMLNFEIDKAVNFYKIPIIVAYTGENHVLNPKELSYKWPCNLDKTIKDGTAKCIHIAFKEKCILAAIEQFSVHNGEDDELKGGMNYYSKESYRKWGYIN